MKKVFLVIALLFGLNVFTSDVSAATHGFGLEAVACSKELYQQEDMYDVFEACRTDYLDGKLNDYILEENGEVEPGSLVLFVNKYIHGGINEVNIYSTKIDFDSRYWKNYEDGNEEILLNYYDKHSYPKSGKSFKWSQVYMLPVFNESILTYCDGEPNFPLTKSMDLSLFGLIIKDDVPFGTKLSISFDSDWSYMLKIDEDIINELDITIKGITLRVSGDNSYLNEIKSNKYIIKREENEAPIVVGAEPRTTINEFLNNFENNDGMLHIYDKDGNEITDYNKYVGSYMKIKLIDNNEIKDELTIAVRGDLDGNGLVNIVDKFNIENIILGRLKLNYLRLQIGDLNGDGKITSTDSTKISSYYLNDITSLN